MGVPADASRPAARTRAVVSPWAWMAVTCLILGVSGGIRLWRELQFWSLARESAACPFPLSDLPRTMGTWQVTDEDAQLDPEVARFAGATDHFVRNYLDQKSGDQASVLALYGAATMVHLHTPEACYPSAGYMLYRGPVDRSTPVPGMKEPLRYRWAVYARKVGGLVRFEEVYYSFLHHGDWLPDVSDRWKTFRYRPGLFKVQIAHPTNGLSEGVEGPSLDLFVECVRQINQRLASPQPGAAETAAR
jgi:hypothetical protein